MKLTISIRDRFINAVMSDVPKEDIQTQAEMLATEWIENKLYAVFGVVNIEKVNPWLKRTSILMPGSLSNFYSNAPEYDYLKTDTVLWDRLERLAKKLEKQNEARRELREKLRSVAYSVTTVKALAEALPEFAKYLPTERTQISMLPVTTGVVDAFCAAGWPRQS